VDSLSSHLATLITTILFYPLESLYLRHLASTFISSSILIGGANLGFQRHVRPLGAWFGGGRAGNMLAYASAMALATGMEAMVSAAIWGVGTAVTVFIGRRKFGWGNL
jgi:hypothetical protein